jgi:D-alanyl-D-alanine carboxypeptidase
VSLEIAMQRVAVLRAMTAPPAPAPVPAPVPATGGRPATFAATLAQATASAQPAAAPAAATPGTYPHLSGDLDANPELLARLERLAAARGERWTVTSGLRTNAEQQRLWDNRASNPFPVARPGTSIHEQGNSADVTINGRPIQDVVSTAELIGAGVRPLAGDAVHVDLALHRFTG